VFASSREPATCQVLCGKVLGAEGTGGRQLRWPGLHQAGLRPGEALAPDLAGEPKPKSYRASVRRSPVVDSGITRKAGQLSPAKFAIEMS
jgi:hypothetical protein